MKNEPPKFKCMKMCTVYSRCQFRLVKRKIFRPLKVKIFREQRKAGVCRDYLTTWWIKGWVGWVGWGGVGWWGQAVNTSRFDLECSSVTRENTGYSSSACPDELWNSRDLKLTCDLYLLSRLYTEHNVDNKTTAKGLSQDLLGKSATAAATV